ncbi:MAG: response regulator [Clostridia bacterium]|nr:response regulator [Clostridia bacterium]
MTILAVDDEPLALELLTDSIKAAVPDALVFPFLKPSKLLEYASENPANVAFLDIRMRGVTGIELAKRLKELNPDINLIFVTGYEEYTGDAMALHASGYIMKPVTVQAVRAELNDLRRPVPPISKAVLRVKCFGNFDVYTADGKRVHFERTKAKELLAYLVYRSGSSCSVKEIAAVLFEDGEYNQKQRNYVQKIISSMLQALRAAGVESVVTKKYNSLAMDVSQLDCDYYRFMELDAAAVNSYSGEFMSQYPWAEFVIGYLEDVYQKQ